MSSMLAERNAVEPDQVIGCQTPRIISTPRYRRIGTGRWDGMEDAEALAYTSPAGQECNELAASVGIMLDPWQQLVSHHGLTEDDAGRWAAFEIVAILSRQNGKDGWTEARHLAGLWLFGEQLHIHTAHEFKTAQESFRRLDRIIEGSYELSRRVKRVTRGNGEEGFELFSGARLRYLARSGSSGRGFSGDFVVMNEAMKLGSAPMDALLPTMSARVNPQILYAGSAGLGAESEQLASLRARALAQSSQPDQSMAYLEWSIDHHTDECARDAQGTITCTAHDDRAELQSARRANPALGIRIRWAHVQRELATMSPEGYDRERLGVGDYPVTEDATWTVVDEDSWRAWADPDSQIVGRVALAAAVTPERTWGTIAVGGRREDGRWHTEIIDYRRGVGWMAPRLLQLVDDWQPCALVLDPGTPAGALVPQLEKAWARAAEDAPRPAWHAVTTATARDGAQAYGQWAQAGDDDQLRHMPHPSLDAAVAGALERDFERAKQLVRPGPGVDIGPVVACTYAVWGHLKRAHLAAEAAPNIW